MIDLDLDLDIDIISFSLMGRTASHIIVSLPHSAQNGHVHTHENSSFTSPKAYP